MPRTGDIAQPSAARRILGSVWLKMLVFIVVFLGAFAFVAGGTEERVEERQAEFMADAVRRAAVQSYALEGRFPDNISHLQEHYGLIIDKSRFAVYYESMGDNLLPQIKVIVLNN